MEAGVGRRVRQVLDRCPGIIEYNDCRFFLEGNRNFRDARDFLDGLFHHVIPTAPDNDRHPEVPARLRGPRRMAASPCMLPSFEARFARTSG